MTMTAPVDLVEEWMSPVLAPAMNPTGCIACNQRSRCAVEEPAVSLDASSEKAVSLEAIPEALIERPADLTEDITGEPAGIAEEPALMAAVAEATPPFPVENEP